MSAEELPILGTEPVSVEFANTWYDGQDFLGTRWFAEVGLPRVRDLVRARLLRDSVHALFTAAVTGTAPPESAVTTVNAAAAAAPTFRQLSWRPKTAFTAASHPASTGAAAVLGRLAAETIAALADDRGQLLRRCEGPGCCLFFVQQHARRRFCHDSCAHRDRQARYYRRRTGQSG